MSKRKILVFVFSLLMIFSLIGQISASYTSMDIVNEFQNGIVDIEISEQDENISNYQMILPFDEISKKTCIVNNGADCYVRVKFLFSNENIVNDTNINGMATDWFLGDDGYYYYTKVLEGKDTVQVFESIKLGDIDSEYQSSDFSIDIAVDAVQSKNFIADFNSANPWGEVEVIKTDNENSNIKEVTPIPDENFKVIYKDDISGMVKNFDSFFNNTGVLMPGDCYEDILEIQNNTGYTQIVYFASQNTLNEEFLNKITFKILNEQNEIVYEGMLGENIEIMLDSLGAKTNSQIKFVIEVPTEITNEFALDKSAVKWVFSTKPIGNVELPQTGDNTHPEIYMILMLVSVIGLFLSVRGVGYGKKNH